ncbi:hypothetical protein M426DRAFT_8060 [Hypoxylon sp. CI-4A]|nr:hypothetical protein M426DRAFT_8060 [Hypoxylon sp. CI-4A]
MSGDGKEKVQPKPVNRPEPRPAPDPSKTEISTDRLWVCCKCKWKYHPNEAKCTLTNCHHVKCSSCTWVKA